MLKDSVPHKTRGTARKGLFISFEGPDGSGKTTQARLLAERLMDSGLKVVLTREPGGTPVGEEIRKLLLNPDFSEMTVACEALLYGASRAQLISTLIYPALKRGEIVISDRYLDSSLVYQGLAGGEDPAKIIGINFWATGKLLPEITFLLDLEAEQGLARIQKKNSVSGAGPRVNDRIEQRGLDFHRRVQEGFLQLASRDRKRFFVVPAEDKPETIQAKIWDKMQKILKQRNMLPPDPR
ncbi:MAG: dTMP kinase [Firmicutes bacterium]|nr:dTMP kinase [Bacillota bacterium]